MCVLLSKVFNFVHPISHASLVEVCQKVCETTQLCWKPPDANRTTSSSEAAKRTQDDRALAFRDVSPQAWKTHEAARVPENRREKMMMWGVRIKVYEEVQVYVIVTRVIHRVFVQRSGMLVDWDMYSGAYFIQFYGVHCCTTR